MLRLLLKLWLQGAAKWRRGVPIVRLYVHDFYLFASSTYT